MPYKTDVWGLKYVVLDADWSIYQIVCICFILKGLYLEYVCCVYASIFIYTNSPTNILT